MPLLIHSSVVQVRRERDVVAELSNDELPLKINDIGKCTMAGNFLAAITMLRECELKLFQCLSLRRKLAAVHAIERPDVPLDWLLIKKFGKPLAKNSARTNLTAISRLLKLCI